MYIEDALAAIIRNAADGGMIPEVESGNIYTDFTAEPEWEGNPKIYVLREDTELIGDLCDGWQGPGTAETTITLAAIGADKRQALRVITDVTKTIRWGLSQRITGLDELTGAAETEIETDPDDEIFLPPYEESGLDDMTISTGDIVEISAGNIVSAGTISAAGRIEGGGWIIAVNAEGDIYPPLLYVPAIGDISSWIITAASGVERFENGAFREQYYQTRKFSALHKLTII